QPVIDIHTTVSKLLSLFCGFFYDDTTTTEIYTLSLHDALPIWWGVRHAIASTPPGLLRDQLQVAAASLAAYRFSDDSHYLDVARSEEHTSELQSRGHLVCRLLLEKKKYGRVT